MYCLYLRFDVTVEDAVAVHVVYRLEHLVHVVLHSLLRQVVPPALDRLVHVHVHELEDQSKTTCGFIAKISFKVSNLCLASDSRLATLGQSETVTNRFSSHLLEDFVQGDDVGMGREALQGLDLSQIIHLQAIKRVF